MANQLKNMRITSTDLVTQGANPDAHVRLFKRKDGMETAESEAGLFRKFTDWVKREVMQKDAQMFTENINREKLRELTSEMLDCCYALSDSLSSIIYDNDIDVDTKREMMFTSLDEFSDALKTSIPQWAEHKKAFSEPVTKAQISQQEEEKPMHIDKSKMTAEDSATLEELEKKYGRQTETPADQPAPSEAELHPEVKKALADFETVRKVQTAEIDELKKSLTIERLTGAAKKYEVLGKKADELAPRLYEMQKSGGTVYDDYVALLDEQLTLVEKGGLFGELGSNVQGSAGAKDELGIAAAEIAKGASDMSIPESIIKAWEQNPKIAAQYEAEYQGGA